MKILDCEVREERLGTTRLTFYRGNDDLQDWYGNGWGKSPYEHNADTVFDSFVTGTREMVLSAHWRAVEPWMAESSEFTKDEMRERLIPCVIVLPIRHSEGSFHRAMLSPHGQRFYMGDFMEPGPKQ